MLEHIQGLSRPFFHGQEGMKVSLQGQTRTFLAEFEFRFSGMGLVFAGSSGSRLRQVPADTEYRMISK
jgi:hypothetical protein